MKRVPVVVGAWAGALLLLELSGAFVTSHYSASSSSLTGSSQAIVILLTLLGAVGGGLVGAWVAREHAQG
jgi:hypothetical protein